MLFISDIHGIYDNLGYIDNIIKKEKIDKLIVLGDLYYYGASYNNSLNIDGDKVKNFLTKYRNILVCMKGNCDSLVDIKSSDFPICSDISMLFVDNLNIYITHGNDFNKNNSKKFNNSVLVYGHEHIPYIARDDDMIYICVGSISLPRGGSRSSYMVYDNKVFTLYDIDGNSIASVKL